MLLQHSSRKSFEVCIECLTAPATAWAQCPKAAQKQVQYGQKGRVISTRMMAAELGARCLLCVSLRC